MITNLLDTRFPGFSGPFRSLCSNVVPCSVAGQDRCSQRGRGWSMCSGFRVCSGICSAFPPWSRRHTNKIMWHQFSVQSQIWKTRKGSAMAIEWFAKYVDRLRQAAEVSIDDAEFFIATANALEGGRPVACLDEALTYADGVIATVRQ